MAEHRDAGVATPTSERDPRLERLLFLSDGVYAIALTLLAVELVLPESAADLHGGALLDSLLESWPRVLAFLISFTVIANFWVGHNRPLPARQALRRRPDVARPAAASLRRLHTVSHLGDRAAHS
jgi:uncharacterized membrane protein